MDITIGEAANQLGTTPGRVGRAIARLGITTRPALPRSQGRGRAPQLLDERDLELLRANLGAAPPSRVRTREELFVLAALDARPAGFASFRSLAEVSGLSPTTVSRVLPRLLNEGLARRKRATLVRSGRVIDSSVYVADHDSPQWAVAANEIALTTLPMRRSTTSAKIVPRRFWHHFWNGEPASLRLRDHADYVASRLLLSTDPDAREWASANLPISSIERTSTLRSADALQREWIASVVATRRRVEVA